MESIGVVGKCKTDRKEVDRRMEEKGGEVDGVDEFQLKSELP